MLHRRLQALDKKGTPIRVGLIGCGRMGQGVINQVGLSPGMRIVAVADIDAARAEAAANTAKPAKGSVVQTNNADEAARAVERGDVVACTDGLMLCHLPLDVVVE